MPTLYKEMINRFMIIPLVDQATDIFLMHAATQQIMMGKR